MGCGECAAARPWSGRCQQIPIALSGEARATAVKGATRWRRAGPECGALLNSNYIHLVAMPIAVGITSLLVSLLWGFFHCCCRCVRTDVGCGVGATVQLTAAASLKGSQTVSEAQAIRLKKRCRVGPGCAVAARSGGPMELAPQPSGESCLTRITSNFFSPNLLDA